LEFENTAITYQASVSSITVTKGNKLSILEVIDQLHGNLDAWEEDIH